MDLAYVLILVAAGACGGFVAGLVGVGGGIIFAPVLFFFFQSTGIPDTVIAPLTIGTSLFCTTVASSMSAWQHHRKEAVIWPVALRVGLLSFVVLYFVIRFITTRSWYDDRVFEVVFAMVLLLVSVRMVLVTEGRSATDPVGQPPNRRPSPALLAGIGSAAGAIAASAGVGGGVVLVPAYHHILRLGMPKSVATSSGTIIFISGLGVLTYALSPAATTLEWTVGYVVFSHGLLLAAPAVVTARLGAIAAHRVDRLTLQRIFAFFAIVVAIKLLVG